VSEYLKLPEETVYKYARTGRMPASKVGRYWRFERSRIDDWVSQNSNQGGKALDVLVVDDDPAVRSLLAQWIMELGFHVASLAGGEDALQWVAQHPCDLVLLDLLMPAPNGVATLRHLRRDHPELDVVIVTAYFDSDLMDEALELGPLTMLKKPIDRNALMAVLSGVASKPKV
jgi:excisionase family DNA binding protein